MKRFLLLAVLLLTPLSLLAADRLEIAPNARATVALTDGSTLTLNFRAGPNGMYRVLAAVGRDDLREWDLTPVAVDPQPAKPAAIEIPDEPTWFRTTGYEIEAEPVAEFRYEPAVVAPQTVQAIATPVKTNAIAIVPPAEMVPNEDYDIGVTGLGMTDFVPGKLAFLVPESPQAKCRLVVQWGVSGLEPVITFRAKQPGAYRITLVKALPNEQLQTALATVTVKGDVPPVPPPIPPDPDPPPGPPSKPRALVIENQEDRTAAQGIVLSSPRVRAAFSGGFRVEDKDLPNPTTELKMLIGRAKEKGLPYLFILHADGRVWWEGKLPATVDETLKLLPKGARL